MSSQPRLNLLFSREELDTVIERLAREITRDYHDKHPVLIGILKGSFMFMADLVRRLDFALEVEFIRLSSYGHSTATSGRVKVVQGLHYPIKGRNILVVEDIIDTGLTVTFLLNYLLKKKPASLKLCTLTNKPARRLVPVSIDYLGFTVPDKFIVGCGIDWDEKFRNLPALYTVEDVPQ